MQIIDNLIIAAPVFLIMFYCLVGLIVAGALSVPLIAYFERRGWIKILHRKISFITKFIKVH